MIQDQPGSPDSILSSNIKQFVDPPDSSNLAAKAAATTALLTSRILPWIEL